MKPSFESFPFFHIIIDLFAYVKCFVLCQKTQNFSKRNFVEDFSIVLLEQFSIPLATF